MQLIATTLKQFRLRTKPLLQKSSPGLNHVIIKTGRYPQEELQQSKKYGFVWLKYTIQTDFPKSEVTVHVTNTRV